MPAVAQGTPCRRARVAVVGAGLAGLAAAWRLVRQGCHVDLFERHRQPGFVAHTVGVPGTEAAGGGVPLRVDVPIRVFYAGYYPHLVRLYGELGVASEPVSYASTFHGADGVPFFRYRNWLVGGASWSWVPPQDLRSARVRRIVAGALRFHRAAPRALARGELAGRTLGEMLARQRHDDDFVRGLLLPAVATVCTCSYEDALRFPAAVIVDYLARGLVRAPVRRAVLGADDVARRLVGGIEAPLGGEGAGTGVAPGGALHLGVPLAGLRREGDGGVALRGRDGRVHRFDHVVLATQADQALALLDDASADERRVLAGFRYRPVDVVMHRDAALLPARRRHWSAVNLLVEPGQAQPQSTIWVPAVQPALAAAVRAAPKEAGAGAIATPDAAAVFQTVHPLRAPRGGTVISHARFERPVVDEASERALAGLAVLHAEPDRRVWFCGSYAQPGIPLLESAVASAEAVARALGAALRAGAGVAPRASGGGARSGSVPEPSPAAALTRPL